MSNGDDADAQDLIKKDLEIKKLKREIAQLSFVADKQAIITPAGEAEFEKRKRELDLASLRVLQEKEVRETERFTQEKSKLDQEIKKLTLEREQLERDSKPFWAGLLRLTRVIGPVGAFATGIIALVISLSSLNVTKHLSEEQAKLSEEQTNKLKADQILDQDKFFRETLEKATDDSTPIFRQVAFIRALDGFWNQRQAPTLASALVSMLVYDPKAEIQQACAQELTRAYNANTDPNDRSVINHLLFGSRGTTSGDAGRLGIVQETWAVLSDQAQQVDPRKALLLNIISKAAGHLETTNFHDFSAEGLLMADAKFAGSYLQGVQATRWTLHNADFSQCDLRSANFGDCSLVGAKLIGTHLAQAIFTGSNLEKADFTNADGMDKCYLAGANISQVLGLDKLNKDTAFDQGAVEMSSSEFEQRWKQNLPIDPDERRSWRQAGFPLGQDGNPVLSDGHAPKNGLQPVPRY